MKILILSFCLMVSLVGCATRPSVLQIFKGGNEVPLMQTSQERSEEPQRSILGKDELSLEDCYQLALSYNDRLKWATENYKQALLLQDRAWSSILPSFRLKTNYTVHEEAAQFGSLKERYEEKISLEQPIFSGFREFHGLGQAKSIIRSKAALLQHEQTQIFLNLSTVFYEILKLESMLRTMGSLIELEQKRLGDTQERYRLGLVRKTEILLIESDLEDAKAKQIRTQGDLKTARARLNTLIGVKVEQPLVDIASSEVEGTLNYLLGRAYQHREDLKALHFDIEAARKEVSYVVGEFWPSIVLTGNWYLDRNGPSENVLWDVSVGGSLPIFEGGEIQARVKEARSKLKQAEILYELQEKTVEEEVTQAFALCEALSEEVKALRKKVELMEENYHLTLEEHQQGLATQLDVQWVYQQWVDARLSLDQALWSLKFSQAQLRFACGGIL